MRNVAAPAVTSVGLGRVSIDISVGGAATLVG
jgi:hypothetical protein